MLWTSLSLWECGLKWYFNPHSHAGSDVTLFVRVWIEIQDAVNDIEWAKGHSLCESVDWNKQKSIDCAKRLCHSLCESVDWNRCIWREWCIKSSHSLCESVDWNLMYLYYLQKDVGHSLCESVDWNFGCWCVCVNAYYVTLFVRVWIEILGIFGSSDNFKSHSLCESVDWNSLLLNNQECLVCHSLCESVDWNF